MTMARDKRTTGNQVHFGAATTTTPAQPQSPQSTVQTRDEGDINPSRDESSTVHALDEQDEDLDTLDTSMGGLPGKKMREYSDGSAISAVSGKSVQSRKSGKSYPTIASSDTAASLLAESTSSTSSSESSLHDEVPEGPKFYAECLSGSPSIYSTLPSDPAAPRTCDTVDFRMFDPFCPQRYHYTGYDHHAEWFDGTSSGDMRFTIDLNEASMDSLPDVRPYLYHVGYWGHWEIEGAKNPSVLEDLDRDQTEEYYVKRGRAYLKSERDKGRGYFLAERDWKPIVEDYGPMPMTGLWGTPRTHEDSGMQEEHSLVCDLDTVGTAILKTNLRTPLPKQSHVKVRPGDQDWDLFIQWLYDRENHGIEQMTMEFATPMDVRDRRGLEAMFEGRFMTNAALPRDLRE